MSVKPHRPLSIVHTSDVHLETDTFGSGERGIQLRDKVRTAFGRVLSTNPGHGTTDDVGSHPDGKGPYGHDDLAGNVWEWMEDEYDPFAYTRATARAGRPGSPRRAR